MFTDGIYTGKTRSNKELAPKSQYLTVYNITNSIMGQLITESRVTAKWLFPLLFTVTLRTFCLSPLGMMQATVSAR